MAIVIRNNGGKWQKASKVEFAAETQLQKLLYDSPELIPTYEDDKPAVFVRESALPGSGYTDLLGVDGNGNIFIVETKLARNDEVRRKVIGQVLEYAAYLWKMSFDDFDSLFVSREGTHVLDMLEAKLPGLVREEVRDAIAGNLSSGSFQLFIAVDQMNEELEKIIGYVSSRGSGLRLEVLEFDLHQSGAMEILVPRRYGQLSSSERTTAQQKSVRTTDDILAAISIEKHKRIFALLVHLWQEAGNLVKPGTVGASFQAKIGEKFRPIFWAYPDNLQNAFSDLSKNGLTEPLLSNYREAESKLTGFNSADVLSKPQPITKFANLSEDTIQTFISISLQLVDDWRSALLPVEM
jgi:hypothetical protein